MKKLFLLSILFLAFTPVIQAQSEPVTEKQKIEAAVTGFFDGLAALDLDKINRFSTADYKILENGVIWNADTVTAKVNQRKGKDFKRINKLDFTETEVRGNTAWTTYHNRADVTANGKTRTFQWLESAVLVKEENNWKIKLLHSTVVEPGKKQ